MNNKKIGLFISSLRKEKNMTQKEIADKLYISDQAVSKWERGLSMPDIGLIEKLSEYLEVSVSEILKGERIEDMTKTKSDEIVKTSIPFFQKAYFKNKIMFISLIAVSVIVLLGMILYILGTVDYIRSVKGLKPIFIYNTTSVSYGDAYKSGTDYYGLGYKISLCDNQNIKYVFQMGHKQKNVCYTKLTCSEKEKVLIDNKVYTVKNDLRTYNYSFFDDYLYLINLTQLVPITAIENEETWVDEMLSFYDSPGVYTTIKKINATTYEMKQTCNLPEILNAGVKNVCSIELFGDQIFGLTRSDIDDQYYKDSCK